HAKGARRQNFRDFRALLAAGRNAEEEIVGIGNAHAQGVGEGAVRRLRNDILRRHDLGFARNHGQKLGHRAAAYDIFGAGAEMVDAEATAGRIVLKQATSWYDVTSIARDMATIQARCHACPRRPWREAVRSTQAKFAMRAMNRYDVQCAVYWNEI